MTMCKCGIWPIWCQLMAILGTLVDMDFKFGLLSSYINFDIQTNFEIGHSIPKHTPKPGFVFLDFGLNFFWSPKLKIGHD